MTATLKSAIGTSLPGRASFRVVGTAPRYGISLRSAASRVARAHRAGRGWRSRRRHVDGLEVLRRQCHVEVVAGECDALAASGGTLNVMRPLPGFVGASVAPTSAAAVCPIASTSTF
jgi:hypothetical protein